MKAFFDALPEDEKRIIAYKDFMIKFPEFKVYKVNSTRSFLNDLRKQSNSREAVEGAKAPPTEPGAPVKPPSCKFDRPADRQSTDTSCRQPTCTNYWAIHMSPVWPLI